MKWLFWYGISWLFASSVVANDLQIQMEDRLNQHQLRGVESLEVNAMCNRLHDRILVIGEQLGYDRISRSVLASKAVHAMTNSLVSSPNHATENSIKSRDFVDLHYIAEVAGLPKPSSKSQYVATAPLFGEAFGLSTVPLILVTADDLKYLPYQQMNSEILLITGSADSLNKSRAERVAKLAGNLNIKIHTLWIGQTAGSQYDGPALPLAWLAAATGGKFVPFTDEACLNKI